MDFRYLLALSIIFAVVAVTGQIIVMVLLKKQQKTDSPEIPGSSPNDPVKLDDKNLSLAEANLKLLEQKEELEDHQMKLAEANLKLLEQSEELEAQKMKMAEANIHLLELKEQVEAERDRSEKLLLNILPLRVANQLKNTGTTQPESYEDVTIFFSDIVNFTQKSSTLAPPVLINELNDIFTGFDQIIKANSCERIKTIGDAYLCVCGLPEPHDAHAEMIVKSAIEIMQFLKKRNSESDIKWEIRAGVHSGQVVGGVVGIEKYIYDVFGDAINTASRMESHSTPMQINISESTWKLVKDKFKFQERETIEVKGKGQQKMFFVEY